MDNNNFLYIAGLILSDVSIHGHKGDIYVEIKSSRKDTLKLFERTFMGYVDNIYKKFYEQGYLVKKPAIKLIGRITRKNPLYSKFMELLRIKMDYKRIKSYLSSKEDILWFFLGLFDGDGSVVLRKGGNVYIRITQTKKDFLEFIANLLRKMKIECSLVRDGRSGSGKEKWAISIVGETKREILEFIAENSRHIERKIRAKLGLFLLDLKNDKRLKEIEILRQKFRRFLEHYKKEIRIWESS